jgi:hypothetical protein
VEGAISILGRNRAVTVEILCGFPLFFGEISVKTTQLTPQIGVLEMPMVGSLPPLNKQGAHYKFQNIPPLTCLI